MSLKFMSDQEMLEKKCCIEIISTVCSLKDIIYFMKYDIGMEKAVSLIGSDCINNVARSRKKTLSTYSHTEPDYLCIFS